MTETIKRKLSDSSAARWTAMLIVSFTMMCGYFITDVMSPLGDMLTRVCGLDQRRAFATSVAVILPLCALSAAVYLLRGGLDLSAALPYLIGGTVGGWAGGRLFKGVRLPWLKRGFGALLIWGGLRCLL